MRRYVICTRAINTCIQSYRVDNFRGRKILYSFLVNASSNYIQAMTLPVDIQINDASMHVFLSIFAVIEITRPPVVTVPPERPSTTTVDGKDNSVNVTLRISKEEV